MHKVNYILSLFICLHLISCSDNKDYKETNDTVQNPTKGLREFSLKNHELDIVIYIPSDTINDEEGLTQPEIIHNDGEARWEIKIVSDPKWHLVIEEMGNEEVSIGKEKQRQANQIFDYKYIEEGDNYMLYTESINADKSTLEYNDNTILPDYHFYCLRTIIAHGDTNKYNLVFKSNEMSEFYKPTIKEMLASALHSK